IFGWLSTHPDPKKRIKTTRALTQQWIQNLNLVPKKMLVNKKEHYRNIDGLVFGNNPREGFLNGARFYHPDLRFQIIFPQGWHVENTRMAVYALDPQKNAQLQLTVAQAPQGTTALNYVRMLAAKRLRPQSTKQATINGKHAVLAIYALP